MTEGGVDRENAELPPPKKQVGCLRVLAGLAILVVGGMAILLVFEHHRVEAMGPEERFAYKREQAARNSLVRDKCSEKLHRLLPAYHGVRVKDLQRGEWERIDASKVVAFEAPHEAADLMSNGEVAANHGVSVGEAFERGYIGEGKNPVKRWNTVGRARGLVDVEERRVTRVTEVR